MGIEIVNKMHTCSVNCVIRHLKGVASFWEKPQYNSNCTSKLRTFVLLTKFFPFPGNTEEWFSPRWGSHASFISKPGWQVKRRRDFIIVFFGDSQLGPVSRKSRKEMSNLLNTELFYSHIRNNYRNIGSRYTRSIRHTLLCF